MAAASHQCKDRSLIFLIIKVFVPQANRPTESLDAHVPLINCQKNPIPLNDPHRMFDFVETDTPGMMMKYLSHKLNGIEEIDSFACL